MGDVVVVIGDALEELGKMSAGTVDLLLTDLPSGETRAKFDRKVDLARFWPLAWRVLRSSGVCVLMAHSFSFAAEVVGSQPDAFRYEWLWRKTIKTGFLNASRSPLREHEYVLVFWRGGRAKFRPQMVAGRGPIHAATRISHSECYGNFFRSTKSRAGATDRYPSTVLDFGSVGTTDPKRIHPQQKPVELMEYLVKTYTDLGDLVVDPYAGSGVVGEACAHLGRRCSCFDDTVFEERR